MRRVWITAALLAGLGGARADSPEVEARHCTTILDLVAEGRAIDVVDATKIGLPAREGRSTAEVRDFEVMLTSLFKKTGEIARREKVGDLAISGSTALIVLERWVFVSGKASYSGCVRYPIAEEVSTSFVVDGDSETIVQGLGKTAREGADK